MKYLRLLPVFTLMFAAGLSAQIQTPGALPADGLKGHWTFENAANLNEATVGVDLVQEHVSGGTIEITAVEGPSGSGAVTVGNGSFFRATHNSGANGGAADTLTNQYTIVMDARVTDLTQYHIFYNTTNDAADNGEIYIDPNGGLGGNGSTGGYSPYGVNDGAWFRLTCVADLGNYFNIYVDGQLVWTAAAGKFDADGRLALNPVEILLAHDNDGEDWPFDIAEVAIYDRALSEQEIIDMAGYAHYTLVTSNTGMWEMNNATKLDSASVGEDVVVTGNHTVVEDTLHLGFKNFAAGLESGASYSITHGLDVVPEGFYGHGTKVNYYALALDVRFPALGVTYELSPGLSVDAEGKIGSDALGWSEFSMKANEWYRIAVSVALENPNVPDVAIWVDSDPVLYKEDLTVDGDLGLDASTLPLFSDSNPIHVSNIRLYNTPIPNSTARSLGGYKHSVMALGGIEVRALQDAYVRGGSSSDKNYNEYRLIVRKSLSGDPSYERHAFLMFDLSTVTEPITSARIRLVTQLVAGTEPPSTLAFYKIADDSWTDSTVTWNTAPASGDLLIEDYTIPKNNPSNTEPFNVYEYDVTAYVQDEINLGDYLVSFMALAPTLETDTDTDIRFFSLEGADSYADLKEWQKPTLVINGDIGTGVKADNSTLPEEIELLQNYPNPFNPETTIEYKLPQTTNVTLRIFNMLGQEIVTLVNHKKQSAGLHQVTWQAKNMASGVYFYKIEAGRFVQTRKMMLLR